MGKLDMSPNVTRTAIKIPGIQARRTGRCWKQYAH